MKISKKRGKGKWFKHESDGESAEFLIRPFPHSKFADADIRVGTDGSPSIGLSIEWIRFDACLEGWKGLDDEDSGKKFPYNAINKKYIFDHYDDVREFVSEKSNELDSDTEKEVKN